MPAISSPLPALPAAAIRPQPAAPSAPDPAVRKAAQAFEAMFLAEMLSHAGLGQVPEAFGGGAGEGAYASFLTHAYAEKLAESGRFGLAEAILRAAAMTGGRDD